MTYYGPAGVAPANLLQVVACSCPSQIPCNSNHCCHKAGLSYTSFCHCEAELNCGNESTVIVQALCFTDDSDEEYNFYFDVYEALLYISVPYVDDFHFLM